MFKHAAFETMLKASEQPPFNTVIHAVIPQTCCEALLDQDAYPVASQEFGDAGREVSVSPQAIPKFAGEVVRFVYFILAEFRCPKGRVL